MKTIKVKFVDINENSKENCFGKIGGGGYKRKLELC